VSINGNDLDENGRLVVEFVEQMHQLPIIGFKTVGTKQAGARRYLLFLNVSRRTFIICLLRTSAAD
jgi:hypothetical protein